MLTSLLSLYIASSLRTNFPGEAQDRAETPHSVKTASVSLTSLLKDKNIPIKNQEYISPIIDARGSISRDLKTGTILYEKNTNTRMPIASITKLMTILIILEENELNEVATVSSNAANIEGSQMHLRTGEQISVENLLYGALIHSANDAAITLAEHNSDNVEAFVKKMNNRATELGLTNTHFSNPVGLDGAKNYSSPYDIAKLGSFVYHNKFIKKAAKIKNLEVRSVSGKYTHKLESTNNLLDSYLNIKGLKTGKTDAAGLCLVLIAENKNGNEIITVVLNSPARFRESKILVDWTFRAFKWQ